MNQSENQADQVERLLMVSGVEEVAGGRSVPAAAGRPDAGGSILDKSLDIVGKRVRVTACGCESVWCEKCRRRMASSRKSYLRMITQGWSDHRMLTLTVDQRRFAGPGEAHDYVKARRLVSEAMRVFQVRRWVAVLEVQKNGWPHWHVIVDRYLDVVAVRAWWTERCGSGPADRQTQVQIERVKSDRVASYLCGYLGKGGKAPEWIRARKNVRGIAVSRTLLAWSRFIDPAVRAACERKPSLRGHNRLVGERVDSCSSSCTLFLDEVDSQGQPVVQRRQFLKRVQVPMRVVLLLVRRLGMTVEVVPEMRVAEWRREVDLDRVENVWVPGVMVRCGLMALNLGECDARRLLSVLSPKRRAA